MSNPSVVRDPAVGAAEQESGRAKIRHLYPTANAPKAYCGAARNIPPATHPKFGVQGPNSCVVCWEMWYKFSHAERRAIYALWGLR